jgi:hypothetical protein
MQWAREKDMRRTENPAVNGHRLVGIASIDAAGTIRLRLVRQRAEFMQPCGELSYDRTHPHYAALLEQLGPLAIGDEKIIHPENNP